MLLSDLIKQLVDIATDVGECDVWITTENETEMYDCALVHYLPFDEGPVLRLEGLSHNTYENTDVDDCD